MEEKINTIEKAAYFAILIIVISAITIMIDNLFLNDRYFNEVIYENDCEYKLPSNYKVVTNGKLYAIKISNIYRANNVSIGMQGQRGN